MSMNKTIPSASRCSFLLTILVHHSFISGSIIVEPRLEWCMRYRIYSNLLE